MPNIENVVAGFFLGAYIDDCKRPRNKQSQYFSEQRYMWIAQYGFNTEYNRKKFHSIVMKLRMAVEEKQKKTISALIFRNSKVILCGAASIQQARTAALRVCRRVQLSLNSGAIASNKCADQMKRLYGKCRVNKFRIHVIGNRI